MSKNGEWPMPASHHEVRGPQTARDRRLIIKVVDYWESLRGAEPFPKIADFDITAISGMADNSFLIDVNSKNVQSSHLRYVGNALAEDCSRDLIGRPVSSVPRGSLVSRLTDHFLQILANRAPMAFEAEYGNGEGAITKYRGIMVPLSDSGKDMDFILGVINSRKDPLPASAGTHRPLLKSKDSPVLENKEKADPGSTLLKLSGAASAGEATESPEPVESPAPPKVEATPDSVVTPFTRETDAPAAPGHASQLSSGPDMLERLQNCRGAAYILQDAQDRAMRTTYKALKSAMELIIAAEADPEGFSALLEEYDMVDEEGDTVMAALRMMFGKDHNPGQLTNYAAALKRAMHDEQTPETLIDFLDGFDGGLDGLVRQEPIPLDLAGFLRSH